MTDWLDEHLETFVKPHLGSIPDVEGNLDYLGQEYSYLGYNTQVTPKILDELKMFWTKGKAMSKGKPILFPGRDAWLLHVLANMEGYPTLFHPEMSRSVVTAHLVDATQFAGCFVIDCGSNGTIPRELGIFDFALTDAHNSAHKLLPAGHEHSVAYGFMMHHAKYWKHADPAGGGAIKQDWTETWEFTKCAQLTQHFVEAACAPRKKTMVLVTKQEAQ